MSAQNLRINLQCRKAGFVPSIADGEDSKGGALYRLMTPDELVERSIAISRMAFDRCEAEGWIKPIPSFDTLREEPGQQAGFVTKGAAE